MLTNNPLIFAGRFFFAENGTTETVSSTPHTVGPDYVPRAPGVGTLCELMGNMPNFSVVPKLGELDVRGPVAGGYAYGSVDTIVTSNDLTLEGTFTDWNEQFLRAVFMLGERPTLGSTAYQPQAMSKVITGWLYIDAGDAAYGQVVAGFAYVQLTVKQLVGKEKTLEHAASFKVLPNALATVNFPVAA